MAHRLGIWLALGAAVTLTGCGEADKAPDSTIENVGGSGGAGGSAGSLMIGDEGGKGGGAGNGGSAPTVMLHVCGMPEQSCPSKTLMDDVSVTTQADLAKLEGVTNIEGNLTIGLVGTLEELHCLENVAGSLAISPSDTAGDTTLWGLRNLQAVGGDLELSSPLGRTFPDCGFKRLSSVGLGTTGGSIAAKGLAETLDLSSLVFLRELSLADSDVTVLRLRGSGPLTISRLKIENNARLTEVSGLAEVTIGDALPSATSAVRIVGNPQLSECRARQLGEAFTRAGAPASSIVIQSNSPCDP